MKKYAVLDFETGGLNPQKNALCSVGIVALDEKLCAISEYYTIINEPGKLVEEEALRVNGLTREQLENGKPVDIVLKEIEEILKDTIIVNHNSAFDVEWLNYRGFEILESIDTMLLSRKKWPSLRAKLSIVCERFSIDASNAHNSLADARMTAEILKRFSEYPELDALVPKKIKFNTYKPTPTETEEKPLDKIRKKYIIISGSRKFFDYKKFNGKVIEVLKILKEEIPDIKRDDVEFIIGDAKGADQLGSRFAQEYNFPFKVFNADWISHGISAGMIRNKEMLRYAENFYPDCLLIAFPADDSIGTNAMIDLCNQSKINCYIFKV